MAHNSQCAALLAGIVALTANSALAEASTTTTLLNTGIAPKSFAADDAARTPTATQAKIAPSGPIPNHSLIAPRYTRADDRGRETPIRAENNTSSIAIATQASNATQASKILTVEDFGAVGDGSWDDTRAFSRYASYLRSQYRSGKGQKAWVLGFGRIYLVSGPVDATNLSYVDFEGNHSTIQYYKQNAETTNAIFDMLGTSDSQVSNLTIKGCTQAVPCTNGVQVGRYTDDQGYAENTFSNVLVDGYFKEAGFHNNGSELLTAYSLTVYNRYKSGCNVTPNKDESDHCSYALIQDGTNHWPMTSNFLPVKLTKDVGISFLNDSFYRPILFNFGDGPAVWMASAFQHHYFDGYTQVQGFGSAVIPSVVLAFPTKTPSQVPIRSLDWDVHDEFGSSVNFYISANNSTMPRDTAPRISGIEIKDAILQSRTAVFGTSPTATFVFLTDLKAMIPAGGTQFFLDAPSKYVVSGDVYSDESGFASTFFNLPLAQQFHGRIRGVVSNNIYGSNIYGATTFGNIRYTSRPMDPVTTADGTILATAQKNSVTEMLPPCATVTRGFPIEVVRTDSNPAYKVTVTTSGTDRIAGAAAAAVSPLGSLQLRCAGDGHWFVIGKS